MRRSLSKRMVALVVAVIMALTALPLSLTAYDYEGDVGNDYVVEDVNYSDAEVVVVASDVAIMPLTTGVNGFANLQGAPGNLDAVRVANAGDIVFDMQDLAPAAAVTRFEGVGNRGVVFGTDVAGQTIAYVTQFYGGGANDPHGWGWAPAIILPAGAAGVSAGNVLYLYLRFGADSGATFAGGYAGVRRGITPSNPQTVVGPVTGAQINAGTPVRVRIELEAADITNGLSLGWNTWGGFNTLLNDGTSGFVVSIDDMLIVDTTLAQDVHFSLASDTVFQAHTSDAVLSGIAGLSGGGSPVLTVREYNGRNFIHVGGRANNFDGLNITPAIGSPLEAGTQIRITGRTAANWTSGAVSLLLEPGGWGALVHVTPAADGTFSFSHTLAADVTEIRIIENTGSRFDFYIYSIIIGEDLMDPAGAYNVATVENFWPPRSPEGLTDAEAQDFLDDAFAAIEAAIDDLINDDGYLAVGTTAVQIVAVVEGVLAAFSTAEGVTVALASNTLSDTAFVLSGGIVLSIAASDMLSGVAATLTETLGPINIVDPAALSPEELMDAAYEVVLTALAGLTLNNDTTQADIEAVLAGLELFGVDAAVTGFALTPAGAADGSVVFGVGLTLAGAAARTITVNRPILALPDAGSFYLQHITAEGFDNGIMFNLASGVAQPGDVIRFMVDVVEANAGANGLLIRSITVSADGTFGPYGEFNIHEGGSGTAFPMAPGQSFVMAMAITGACMARGAVHMAARNGQSATINVTDITITRAGNVIWSMSEELPSWHVVDGFGVGAPLGTGNPWNDYVFHGGGVTVLMAADDDNGNDNGDFPTGVIWTLEDYLDEYDYEPGDAIVAANGFIAGAGSITEFQADGSVRFEANQTWGTGFDINMASDAGIPFRVGDIVTIVVRNEGATSWRAPFAYTSSQVNWGQLQLITVPVGSPHTIQFTVTAAMIAADRIRVGFNGGHAAGDTFYLLSMEVYREAPVELPPQVVSLPLTPGLLAAPPVTTTHNVPGHVSLVTVRASGAGTVDARIVSNVATTIVTAADRAAMIASGDVITVDASAHDIEALHIPRIAIAAFAAAGNSLEVVLPLGAITVGPEALAVLANNRNINITFRINEVDIEDVPVAARIVPANATLFQVAIAAGSRMFVSFDQDVTVSIPGGANDTASSIRVQRTGRVGIRHILVPLASRHAAGELTFSTDTLGLFVVA